VIFSERVSFAGAQFSHAQFENVNFSDEADFFKAKFSGEAWFFSAQFSGKAEFIGVEFFKGANFLAAEFLRGSEFGGSRVRKVNLQVWPAGWSVSEAGKGEEVDWLYLMRIDESIDDG
jgi:uncharacterized protein YjbI with pentapeptide repeats